MPNAAHLFPLGVTAAGAVPQKARPSPRWGSDPALVVDQALSSTQLKAHNQSILHLHLAAHSLLVVLASISNDAAAAATWLDAVKLQTIAELELPAGVCCAWSAPGANQMSFSCNNGDMYVMQTDPQVSPTVCLHVCVCLQQVTTCKSELCCIRENPREEHPDQGCLHYVLLHDLRMLLRGCLRV